MTISSFFAYCRPTFLLFLSLFYGSFFMNYISQKELCYLSEKRTTPIRNWATVFADPSFTTFWLLFSFLIFAAFEVMISNNYDTRHIKLPERNKVLMVRESVNNNNNNKSGSYLEYSKYGAFTLIIKTNRVVTYDKGGTAKREGRA
jgi:hypothetical protein